MQELLFVKSEYSILQAASGIKDISKEALDAGYRHVILADNGSIAGIPQFLRQTSIHPIPGVSLSIDFQIALIAKKDSSFPKIIEILKEKPDFQRLKEVFGSSKDTICLVHINDFLKKNCKEEFDQGEYDKLTKKLEDTRRDLEDLEKIRDITKKISSRVFFKKESSVELLSGDKKKEAEKSLEKEKKEAEEAKKEIAKVEGKIRRRKSRIKELEAAVSELERVKECISKNEKGVADGQIKKTLQPYMDLFGDDLYNLVFSKDDELARILRFTKKYGIKNILAKYADMSGNNAENTAKAEYINTVSGENVITGEDYISPFDFDKFPGNNKKEISFENDEFTGKTKARFFDSKRGGDFEEYVRKNYGAYYEKYGERLEQELKEIKGYEKFFANAVRIKEEVLGKKRISCNKAGSVLLYILGLSSIDPVQYGIPFDGFDGIRFFVKGKLFAGCGRGLKEQRAQVPDKSFDILTGLETDRNGILKEDLPVITNELEKCGYPVFRIEEKGFVSAVETCLESIYCEYGKKITDIPLDFDLINQAAENKNYFLLPCPDNVSLNSIGSLRDLADALKGDGGYWRAVLLLRCAWLKSNYPKEYFTACLNSLGDECAILKNCGKYGLKLECPDINRSGIDYIIKQDVLLYGLSSVKDVGRQAEAIVKNRGSGYRSFADFLLRNRITKQAVRSLILAGAFSGLYKSRSGLLLVYEQMYKRVLRRNILEDRIHEKQGRTPGTKKEEQQIQKTLQRETEEKENIEKSLQQIHIPTERMESLQDRAMMESSVLPFNASRNVLDLYGESLPFTTSIANIKEEEDVKLFGFISVVKRFRTKKNNREMASFILEDRTGKIAVTCWPKTLEQYGKYVKENEAVLVYGRMEKDPVTEGCQVFASFIGIPESFLPQTVVLEESFGSFDVKKYGNDIEKTGSRILVYCRDTGKIEVTDYYFGTNLECDGNKKSKVRKYLEKIGKS